ncbi:hypothetical protein LOTGIDRAFT_223359 [Lottia gigantea]|uniref:DNA-directed RNA polymerase n=1 Tax=Lottia gigantea TaxID=225164 RepID=V3ZIY9_LOTGI|nr:hypothetical protein LOTGIDRAFT_223359 [Lottia gigantea]ESO82315.1 hypothetical protein LOTGIDRAFT_223359 [Lottia gigantea]
MKAGDLPMLSPPLPWVKLYHGGLVLCNVKLVRSSDVYKQQENRIKDLPAGQINPVLDSLNSLASCAWKINKPILDIAIGMFNDKGNSKLEIPPPQSELPIPSRTKRSPDMTQQERSAHFHEQSNIARLRAENWSLRSFELYRLSVANKYRDEIIWFPHNIDFRGRTYPISPYLNHLGSDISRGMLMFAKGRPLGPDGLDWLKIHLVNLIGLRKRSSNAERLKFAETLIEEIQDSADYPMTGKLWWQDREEPWQVLACCMEITKAIRSPDHTKFISHFPVHQDGSCNGLQHYAALGRDSIGAKSVNLCSYPVPQDVYSEVVDLVEKLRHDDAEKGNKIAKMLEGKVIRKVTSLLVVVKI